MPRPNTFRQIRSLPVGGDLEPVAFWEQPQGLDFITPLSRLAPNKVPQMNNLRISDARRLRVREGTDALGSAAGSTIVGQISCVDAGGVEYVVRVLTDGVEILGADVWVAASGPTLDIPEGAFVEFTAWGGDLLFNDTVTGLYSINLQDYTYELVANTPAGLHITTFAGRVIISNVLGYATRIQWSVRNNSTDWSGPGSGYDDMLSAPGGIVDVQHGVYPVNDQEALIVRSSSIWVLNQTGNAVTPFNFFYRFSDGTDAPNTIAKIPNQGLIMLGKHDVLLVTPGQIQSLGLPIRSQLIGPDYLPAEAVGVYDAARFEYRLHVPESGASSYKLWRYHLPTQTWSCDTYPLQIRRISAGNTQIGTAIEDLIGTIEALTGTIEQLGIQGRREGVLFVFGDTTSAYETEAGTDINTPSASPVVASITSGLVQPGGPLMRATLIGIGLEYTVPRNVTALLETSSDGGTTWTSYPASFTFSATVPALIKMLRSTIDRDQYMFRLTIGGSGQNGYGFELVAAYAYGQPGAPRAF